MIQPAHPAPTDPNAILTQEPGIPHAGRVRGPAPESRPFADLVRKHLRSPASERKTRPQEQPDAQAPAPDRRAAVGDAPVLDAEASSDAQPAAARAAAPDEQPVSVDDADTQEARNPAATESTSEAHDERNQDAHPAATEDAALVESAPPAPAVIAPAASASPRKPHAPRAPESPSPAGLSIPAEEAALPFPVATGDPSPLPQAEPSAPASSSTVPAAHATSNASAPAPATGAEADPAGPGASADAPTDADADALPLPIADAGASAPAPARTDSAPASPAAGPFRLELAPARSTSSAQGLPPPAQPEAVEAQFARGLAAVLNQKGGSVTLRLAPESLGQLRVRLETTPGHVAVQFEVGSAAARELLDDSLVRLRASLEARGLTVDRASVVLDPTLNRGDERHSENGARQWTGGGGQDGRQPGQTGDGRGQDAPDHRRRAHEPPGPEHGAERRISLDDRSAQGGAPRVATLRLNAVA